MLLALKSREEQREERGVQRERERERSAEREGKREREREKSAFRVPVCVVAVLLWCPMRDYGTAHSLAVAVSVCSALCGVSSALSFACGVRVAMMKYVHIYRCIDKR